MADLGTLLLRLAADAGQFESDLGRAARIAEKRSKEIEANFGRMAAVVLSTMAAAAGALGGLAAQSIKNAAALAEMAQKVGASVESLSTLGFAAQQSGLNIEQLQGGLVKLAKNASDASRGIGEAGNGFDALGIKVQNADGSLKATDVLLREVAGKMAQYEDGANKTAIAVNLFGRAGADLIPLLNEGADGIAELEERARDLGLEIGTNTAEAAEKFGDQLDQLKALATGLGNDLAEQLLPTLLALTERMTQSGIEGRNAAGNFEWLAQAIDAVAFAATAAKNTIEILVNVVVGWAGLLYEIAENTIQAVGSIVDAFIAYNKALLSGDFSGAVDVLAASQQRLHELAAETEVEMLAAWTGMKDGITTNAAEIGHAWDAIGERAVEAVKVSKEAIATLAPAAMKLQQAFASLDLSKGMGGLVNAFMTGVEGGKEFAAALVDLTTESKKAAPAIVDLGNAAAEQEKKLKTLLRELERLEKQYDREQMQAEALRIETERLAREQQQHFDEQARDLENEIRLLGLDTEERERAIIALEAERMARDDTGKVIEEQRQRYEGLLTTLQQARKIEEAARQFESIWTNAAEGVGDALTTALFDGAEDGADAIKNVMEQLARDLVRFWLQQNIIVPIQAQMQGQTGNFGGFGNMVNGRYAGSNTAFGSSFFGDSAGQWFGGNTGTAAIGNYAAAAGGIYGVYDVYRNGPGGTDGALQGAAAGAAAGTAIMPGIGTAIGAIVGLLAGFFGGGEPTIRVADRENDARATSRLDDRIGVARDRMPEGTATRFAEGIAQFDNAIAQMLDGFEEGADYIQGIRAEIASWSIRVEGDAATVENVLNQRFSAMLGAFDETVAAYVGTAGKVEERVQRLSDALFMVDAVANGGLVDSFEMLADILGDYRVGTEAIEAVYQRVAVSTALFEEALDLMGISLDLSREGLIRFATDITEAAGGLEQAQSLWSSYFGSFYTETERAAMQLERLNESAREQFADIGQSFEAFTGSGGLQAFRQMFEQILPTLTAEQVAQWLEAAQALGYATQAQAAYNAMLGQTINTIRDDGLSLGNPGQVGGEGAIPPVTEVGGSPGGREDGLVIVIPPIEFPPIDFGNPGSGGTPGDDLSDEIDRRYQRELDWLRRLGDLQDSLMLDEQLSTLTPEQMLAEAQAQYEAALAGSMAGDENARADFDRAVRELLGQGRDFYSSSDAYTALFDRVQADIASLIAASPATTAAVTASASLNSAIATPASAADEVKALREDNEDQTVAIVERLTAVENENRQMKELLGQSVAELRRIRNGSPTR